MPGTSRSGNRAAGRRRALGHTLPAIAALLVTGSVWIAATGLLTRSEPLAARRDVEAVSGDPAGRSRTHWRQVSPHQVERLRVKVLETLPHDPESFTQGLEMAGGTLYEGTGLSGQSSVRSGAPGKPPMVHTSLPAPLFGEGITLGRTLWQLTWRDRIAIERDATTLRELRRVPYPDEGWGICFDRGRRQSVTSDGSARLTFRDPRTLAKTGEVTVTEDGRPVTGVNELERADHAVYANVLPTERIVRIDPVTGAMTASIGASGLLHADELVPGATRNGIAAVPATDQFLLTGKFWPKMFHVARVPAQPPSRTAR
ncbi:glutaminyl-peptide cyclotransferase [Streptomyces sp. V3I7]|uniref:glutaminyl-peptide cyclotransferase n=1 Tax=Streptomyces sp. V3I7 TaxID=3042278 RepID=UPI00278AEB4D|nr:glutaminyl-peptide cyclotransferase [Streptomyces sp. V3I7]MDQ0989416.1 glutamine cyclotransferase [Streptomyces sp. V3I7]